MYKIVLYQLWLWSDDIFSPCTAAYNYGGQTAGNYPNYGNYYDRYNSGQQTATGADSRTDYSTGYNYGKGAC